MFSDKFCLTQAVLEGRKTQTRRVINGVDKIGTWESNPWVFVYEFELVD